MLKKLSPYIKKSIKARITNEERLRRKIERDGKSLLSSLFFDANKEFEFDPSISLEMNIQKMDDIFEYSFAQMRDYYHSIGSIAVSFGREQVIKENANNRLFSIKSPTIEITVNWAQADQGVIDWLDGGGNFTNGYFDLVTSSMALTNRNWLTREYRRYINGEQNLQTTRDRLSALVYGTQRSEIIIRTDITQIFSQGQQESYRKSGTKRNRWNTRFDELVCPICGPLNGLVANIGSSFAGTRLTSPAAHIGCRCFLSPVPMKADEIEELLKEKNLIPSIVIIDKTPKKEPAIDNEKIAPSKEDIKPETKEETINRLLTEKKNKILRANEQYKQDLIDIAEEGEQLRIDINRSLDALDETDSEELRKEYRDKYRALVAKENSLDSKRIAAWEKSKEAIFYEDHANLTASTDIKTFSEKIRDGYRDFNRMLSSRHNFDYDLVIDQIKNAGRDYASPHNQSIHIHENSNVGVVIHEIGHVLETNNDAIAKLADDFLSVRGGELVAFVARYPNSDYRDDEEFFDDKFYDDYVGKNYDEFGLTEIVSMGMEAMYNNPMEFYNRDPEHFEMTLRIMNGVL